MKSIYLAGGFHGELRKHIVNSIKDRFHIFDPSTTGLTDPREYTHWDLNAIDKSDIVLAFMDSSNPSGYGMSLEVGYAKAKEKYIIFVDAMANDYRSKYLDMVKSVSHTVQNVEEAVRLLYEYRI